MNAVARDALAGPFEGRYDAATAIYGAASALGAEGLIDEADRRASAGDTQLAQMMLNAAEQMGTGTGTGAERTAARANEVRGRHGINPSGESDVNTANPGAVSIFSDEHEAPVTHRETDTKRADAAAQAKKRDREERNADAKMNDQARTAMTEGIDEAKQGVRPAGKHTKKAMARHSAEHYGQLRGASGLVKGAVATTLGVGLIAGSARDDGERYQSEGVVKGTASSAMENLGRAGQTLATGGLLLGSAKLVGFALQAGFTVAAVAGITTGGVGTAGALAGRTAGRAAMRQGAKWLIKRGDNMAEKGLAKRGAGRLTRGLGRWLKEVDGTMKKTDDFMTGGMMNAGEAAVGGLVKGGGVRGMWTAMKESFKGTKATWSNGIPGQAYRGVTGTARAAKDTAIAAGKNTVSMGQAVGRTTSAVARNPRAYARAKIDNSIQGVKQAKDKIIEGMKSNAAAKQQSMTRYVAGRAGLYSTRAATHTGYFAANAGLTLASVTAKIVGRATTAGLGNVQGGAMKGATIGALTSEFKRSKAKETESGPSEETAKGKGGEKSPNISPEAQAAAQFEPPAKTQPEPESREAPRAPKRDEGRER